MSLKQSITSEEIKKWQAFNNTLHYPTSFKFLQSHCGLRPDMCHGLMGTMGSGKSSFVKAIVAEIALKSKVHVHLSEEKRVEYQPDLMICNPWPQVLDNISWTEERELSASVTGNQKHFHEHFMDTLSDSGAKFTVIDNITTSMFYGEEVGIQGQIATCKLLLDIPKKLGVGVLWVAHTGSHVHDNYQYLIKPEDIRGNRQLPIRTEYLYIIQKYTSGDKQYRILNVGKHRHHKNSGGFYLLNYENGKYDKDEPIPFESIKTIFKGRDRLTGN